MATEDGGAPESADVTILHFNDVYNITPSSREPVGGAARFCTKIRELCDAQDPRPLVLFSGDAFFPSIMSTVLHGRQMVPCLNAFGIDAACIGNHELDGGLETLTNLITATNFPWLISNVWDRRTSLPMGGGQTTVMLEWGPGWKIGVMGLVEHEWLATLNAVSVEDLLWEDPVPRAAVLAEELRQQGAHAIVALTHQRMPNDERLAREATDLDIVLAGHDHDYAVSEVAPGRFVIKSGTDFRDLTSITMRLFKDGTRAQVLSHQRHVIDSQVPPDPVVEQVVEAFASEVASRMDDVVGETAVALDARFSVIRTAESNVGNLVCDLMREAGGSDVAVLNSGTLRADCVYTPGPLTQGDLMALVPMHDELAVLRMTGETLLHVLENGVCMYPRLEGRFLQVSGVTFTFDAARPPFSRVTSALVGGVPLLPSSSYTVTTKAYLIQGKDGFTMLPGCEVVVPPEELSALPMVLRKHLQVLETMSGLRNTSDAYMLNTGRRLSGAVIDAHAAVAAAAAAGVAPATGDAPGRTPTSAAAACPWEVPSSPVRPGCEGPSASSEPSGERWSAAGAPVPARALTSLATSTLVLDVGGGGDGGGGKTVAGALSSPSKALLLRGASMKALTPPPHMPSSRSAEAAGAVRRRVRRTASMGALEVVGTATAVRRRLEHGADGGIRHRLSFAPTQRKDLSLSSKKRSKPRQEAGLSPEGRAGVPEPGSGLAVRPGAQETAELAAGAAGPLRGADTPPPPRPCTYKLSPVVEDRIVCLNPDPTALAAAAAPNS